MKKKNIILDCDPGMDDAMAIIMACKSDALDVKAITTVTGNYPVDVTSVNARKILELIGMDDIPVAKGMSKPMVRNAPTDPFTHGEDGLANSFLPEPKIKLHNLHAVDLMIQTIKENQNNIYLIMIGPMTNLAMAIRKDPTIIDMISGVYAISGAFGLNEYAFKNATGATPQSEWNVYVDPEATKLVYESGLNVFAFGLDVATHFDVNLSDENVNLLRNSSKNEANFWAKTIEFVKDRGFEAYCTVIDCIAVGYAIDDSLIETMKAKVGVETEGTLTLGMTVIDRRHHHTWEELPEISIGLSVDYRRFLNLLMDLVMQ